MNMRFLSPAIACSALLVGCDTETTEALGTIRTVEGEAIPGAELELWTTYLPGGRPKTRATSDNEGRFRIAFSNVCGFVDCAFSGDLVVDADGYESIVTNVPSGKGNRVDVTLHDYDELPVEASGIPDEQPRPVLETTFNSTFEARLPNPATYGVDVRRNIAGNCSSWITRNGRTDQLSCEDPSGTGLGLCFLDADRAGTVLCHPEGLSRRRVDELAATVTLPKGRPETSDPDAFPLGATLATSSPHALVRCSPPSTPMTTNLGEPIAYECTGQRTTWLLDDLRHGPLWTATRVGSAGEPEQGIVHVLGRRTVTLQSVIR